MNTHFVRSHRSLRLIPVLAAMSLVAAACGGDEATPAPTAEPSPLATALPSTSPAPAASSGTALAARPAIGDPRPAPELAELVQPDGSAFDLASFEGSNVLVFFGYTHCPDVCPATIGELFGVFEASPATQAVFVSVDPERDTPEFLTEWTRYLPQNLHAVTGSPGAIRRAAENYGVKYARVETTSTAGYTMSHSADLYLIDESGQLRQAYPFGTPAAEIVQDLEMLEAG
jgi:protein SCO1/2